MAAEDVAKALQEKFLLGGNFVLAGGQGVGLGAAMPAAAGQHQVPEFEEHGFAGLAVQSVGYQVGIDNPKVYVYVTKGSKRAERTIGEGDDAVQVEVSRVGKVMVRPEAASASVNHGHVFIHNARVACGSSCAPATDRLAGTFGALVALNNVMYVLSNNHVLGGCNHTPVGAPILAPSAIDAAPTVPAPRAIASHERIIELRSGAPGLVNPCQEDVALARVGDPNLLSSRQGSGAESYDTPASTMAPVSGLRVKKVGRTTGLTLGTVESKALPFAMPYKASLFAATVWFTDVWLVRADQGESFALSGDSGSLVVNEAGDFAVGLVFAATSAGDLGFIVPIQHVLACLGGAALISGHHA